MIVVVGLLIPDLHEVLPLLVHRAVSRGSLVLPLPQVAVHLQLAL